MTTLYILDVPEYVPLARAAAAAADCDVDKVGSYFKLTSSGRLTIERRDTGLDPAVWFGALVAGYDGVVAEFSEQRLVIDPAG